MLKCLGILALLAFTIPSISVAQVDNTPPNFSCAQVGESAGGGTGTARPCCDHLLFVSQYHHETLKAMPCQQRNAIPAPPGNGGTCTACGNGRCDTQTNEDACNCPEDCK